MDEPATSANLTKRHTKAGPVREHPAKGGFDDEIHLVAAAPADLVDPSALRAYCGAEVLQVYTDSRPATCPRCPRRERAE